MVGAGRFNQRMSTGCVIQTIGAHARVGGRSSREHAGAGAALDFDQAARRGRRR